MKNNLIVLMFGISFWGCQKDINDTITVVPISPTELEATLLSSTQVDLNWSDKSTNEDGFKVQRKKTGGNFIDIGTTKADVTSFSDSTLNAIGTYTYRVYAYNSVGNSLTYTNEVTVSTSAPLLISTNGINTITNSTAETGGNIANDGGYAVTQRGVVWSTSPNPTILLANKTVDGSGIGYFKSLITGLQKSTTYFVRAYATNISGTVYGNEISFKTVDSEIVTGLVAHYPFTGNAGDSSGFNNHGIVNGAILVSGKSGIANTAYALNGIHSINLPKPFFEGKQVNVFTFSVRIRFNSTANSPSIWSKSLNWGEISFYVNKDNSIMFLWANTTGGNTVSRIFTTSNIVQINNWYDITVVCENKIGTIYLNGTPIETRLSWVGPTGGIISTTEIAAYANFAQTAGSSTIGGPRAFGYAVI